MQLASGASQRCHATWPSTAFTLDRGYEASIPLYVQGDTASPHLVLAARGIGRFPRLTFDAPEVLLPPVRCAPNRVCESLTAQATAVLPEGNLIGLAKERLPVVVTCACAAPASFTAPLEFLDDVSGAGCGG